jgi:hypothetical protein
MMSSLETDYGWVMILNQNLKTEQPSTESVNIPLQNVCGGNAKNTGYGTFIGNVVLFDDDCLL